MNSLAPTISSFEALHKFSGPQLVDRINKGVRASAFGKTAKLVGQTAEELARALGLSTRTLRTRDKLSADESERVYRAYRVYQRAFEVLESDEAARLWLNTPQRALGDSKPLALLVRDVGMTEVLNVLGAIEDGGYL